jgi:hypothetical protein
VREPTEDTERLENVATPLPLVVTSVVPSSEPPPDWIDATTWAPPTRLLLTSLTSTTGDRLKTLPVNANTGGCVTTVTEAARPAPRFTVLDVTLIPALAKRRVRGPTVPVIFRFVNVASPDALVATIVVPPIEPPPDWMEAVTLTPPTGFPAPSDAVTTGCWPNAMSFEALLDGCVEMTSCASGPAWSWMLFEVPVAEPAVNRSVRGPTVPTMARLPNVARPDAFVVAVSVPPIVPPPVAIDAVTTAPGMSVPAASRTSTEGC